MLNEILFFSQLAVLLSFLFISLRLGKTALYVFICSQPLFCNIFTLKQICLFGLQVTPAESYAILGVLGMNLMREFYDRHSARLAIYFSFITLILFSVMTQFQILYTPNRFDWGSVHYNALFGPAPRIITASLLAFFLSERLDLLIFSFLKERVSFGNVGFRFFTSTVISQFFDSLIITFGAFYGIIDNLWDLVTFGYLVKLIAISLTTPMASFSKSIFVRRAEV